MAFVTHIVRIENITHLKGVPYELSVTGGDIWGATGRVARLKVPIRSSTEVDLLEVQFDKLLVDSLCEWNEHGVVRVYLDRIQKTTAQIGSWKYGGTSEGGLSNLPLYLNGVLLDLNCQALNFVNGLDRTDDDPGVFAEMDSTVPSQANLYIHPPKWSSHFNTVDGSTNALLVADSENQCSQLRRISGPTGTLGGNFEITGLSPGDLIQGTHYDPVMGFATLETFSVLNFTSSFEVKVMRADGSTPLAVHNTGPIPQVGYENLINGIRIVVGSLVPDVSRYKSTVLVQVYIQSILNSASLSGGRYYLSIQQWNGPETPLPYLRYFFLDTNAPGDARDPYFTGAYLTEGGVVDVKYLSGIRYYGLNSQFNLTLQDITQLNHKTFPSNLLEVDVSSMGIGGSTLSFTGEQLSIWTTAWNSLATCSLVDLVIDQEDFRHIGEFTSVRARFPHAALGWVNPTSWENLITSKYCIDTYLAESTDAFEPFTDEDYRRTSFNLAGSYNPGVPWDSTQDLNAYDDGYGAMVQSGQLTHRSGDWASYLPGGSPDYSTIPASCTYYRRFLSDGKAYTSARIFLTVGDRGTLPQLVNALKTGVGARMYIFLPNSEWRVRGSLHEPFNFVDFNFEIMNSGVYDDTLSVGCFDTSDEASLTVSFGHRGMNGVSDIVDIQLELDDSLLSVSSIAVQFQGA